MVKSNSIQRLQKECSILHAGLARNQKGFAENDVRRRELVEEFEELKIHLKNIHTLARVEQSKTE